MERGGRGEVAVGRFEDKGVGAEVKAGVRAFEEVYVRVEGGVGGEKL